ncbi:hypothetical protein A3K87_13870 [Variovorax paradoxus]|uniref:Carrier domain-containing protein n=1 Tax=Variovorax paradoxus TaxID=34073 RepID=A0AA91DPC1_VARPD|nr:non-ribosomal peptide synthetase [Variovorax paradoxus]OAK64483.1 hypothetical protein A3K87_13870 [Variovorax paradoxus]
MIATIVSRFRQIVRAQPARLAVVSDDHALTYMALQQRSEEIAGAVQAWFLAERSRRVAVTDVIGIRIEKCVDLYAAMLGVLATGASYVPLDPQLPPDTQEFIAGRCGCELVLSLGTSAEPPNSCRVIDVRAQQVRGTSFEPSAEILPTDLCYTIFTSGSTGNPKGVAATHANVLNLTDWAIETFGLGPGTQALQYSTINFDASVLDIYPTLLSGATLHAPSAQQRMSVTALENLCRRRQVDHAFLPPTLLGALAPERFENIRTILTGGEPCNPQVVRAWSSNRKFYNLYGPAECTVLATCKRMNASVSSRNLGRAITGTRVHVLDAEGRPARRGELHIAGLGVTPGYVADSATTASRFIRHPRIDASVLYRTGDIAELDEAGDLHFIGRKDRQVKVRGFRVELEEIEGALQAVGCRQAVVKLHDTETLVAYISTDEPVDVRAVKGRLQQLLASFKVPQFIVQLAELPLKPNGKVDHDRLPAVRLEAAAGFETLGDIPMDENYRSLAALWACTLSIDAEVLSPASNFRDLGGTSIHVLRLLDAVESRFGINVSFIEFFNNPTLQFIHNLLQQPENSSCCQP